MKCPYCEALVPHEAPCCPECGFRTQPAPAPTGKLELTDEQIMAFAGFQSAQYDLAAAARSANSPDVERTQRKVKKIVMFVVTGFIVPLFVGYLYTQLNHSPATAFSMDHPEKILAPKKDAQTTLLDHDLAEDAKR